MTWGSVTEKVPVVGWSERVHEFRALLSHEGIGEFARIREWSRMLHDSGFDKMYRTRDENFCTHGEGYADLAAKVSLVALYWLVTKLEVCEIQQYDEKTVLGYEHEMFGMRCLGSQEAIKRAKASVYCRTSDTPFTFIEYNGLPSRVLFMFPFEDALVDLKVYDVDDATVDWSVSMQFDPTKVVCVRFPEAQQSTLDFVVEGP
ncbi:MAG: hypothetical protein JSS66_05575 [Armatimonadetes bacterium]|nr:hypothetical protein [Armatimonadota bacterium]